MLSYLFLDFVLSCRTSPLPSWARGQETWSRCSEMSKDDWLGLSRASCISARVRLRVCPLSPPPCFHPPGPQEGGQPAGDTGVTTISSHVTPQVATPPPAGRVCRRCGLVTKNHPWRCGEQHCTLHLPESFWDTSGQARSPPAREVKYSCVFWHCKDEVCVFPCTGCKGRLYYW